MPTNITVDEAGGSVTFVATDGTTNGVTTNGTQTLTNKTINLSNNIFLTTKAQLNTAVTNDDVVFVGDTFFSTRAAFVAWVSGKTPSVGYVVNAGGVSYLYTGIDFEISDLEGWRAATTRTPEHFGAVGDGEANDTAAVNAWLSAGGGIQFDYSKTYSINPMILATDVTCHTLSLFVQRSGSWDWTAVTGCIEIRGNCRWSGFKFDGNRLDPAVNAGMAAILGTSPANIISNKVKAGLYINAQNNNIVVDLDNMEFVNCLNFGLMLAGSTNGGGRYISGRIGTVAVKNSGAVASIVRCRNMPIGRIEGWDIDNRINGSNEWFFPFSNNTLGMGRCRNCPVDLFAIYRQTGRPGAWLSGANQFIVPITQTSCIDSPIASVQVRGFHLPLDTASDTGAATIASLTSALGFSDVSNIRCGSPDIWVEGDFSQAWEIIPGDDTPYGRVVLRNTGGQQGVDSGSVGVACHGGQRYEHNQGTGRSTIRPQFRVEHLEIHGGHFGLNMRTNHMVIGNLVVRGTRSDAVLVGYNNQAEWGTSHTETPSLTAENVDIQWCGGEGLRVTNGGQIVVKRGIIANNCQMSGYTDPTTGTAFTRSAAVAYDPADATAGPVGSITLENVVTNSLPSFSLASGASFLPRSPLAGSLATINDARINLMAMTFDRLEDVNIGQRLRIENIDTSGVSDVDVWPRAIIGNLVMVEVASAQYGGAWSDALSRTALSGTWAISAGALVANATGGNVYAEMTGPAFIATPSGHVLFENPMSANQFNIQDDKIFGATFGRTLTAAVSGATLSKISVPYGYTQRQTTRAAITHANVALAQDNQPMTTSGAETLTNKTIDTALNTLIGIDSWYYGVLTAPYTLTSTTALQPLFNWSAAGALTLPVGTYVYECLLAVTGMDAAAASNLRVDILGAGTATLTNKMIRYLGHDAGSLSSVTTATGGIAANIVTPANLSTGAASGGELAEIRGTFTVTASGTIIPSVVLAVAAAAVVGAGSCFRALRIGATPLSAGWT